MSVDEEDVDPLVESTGDKVHRVVRAGLSTIPGAVELFTALVTPPIERRKQKWMIDVTEALQELEAKESLDVSEVFENEEFVSTLVEASTIAIRNHEQEKLDALRSAVLNSAEGNAPEFAKREIFLRYVGELTTWHLRLLSLFNEPVSWFERSGKKFPSVYSGARTQVLEAAFPELKGDRDFYDQLWKDLHSRGLLNTDSPHAMMTGGGLSQSCTTETAKSFLKFVTREGHGI